MGTKRAEQWPGGYVRRGAKGRKSHIIRRRINGVLYEVSTRCSSLRAAMKELDRFEADPPGYIPGGDVQGTLYLDAQLVSRFLAAHVDNSRPWLTRQKKLLAWWSSQLRGVDLRRATLRDHILPALEDAPGKPPRIAVIKRLYSWLRELDMLEASQDPTLGKLKIPQAKVSQIDRSKVIPREHYEAARRHLIGIYRDGMDVLAGTGWHTTELQRFAKAGVVEAYHGEDPQGAAVLEVLHKSGIPHRTIVTAEVAAAARRLREHGGISLSRFHSAVVGACKAAGVPKFTPGRFRHTIATLATESGHDELASRFLGHRSATTTRRFYSTRATPPKVPTLR